mgnify:FL=1
MKTEENTMTRDSILTAYEDLWRQAALEDRRQFFGEMAGGVVRVSRGVARPVTCALLVPEHGPDHRSTLAAQAVGVRVRWRCDCGYGAFDLAGVMIHLNNAHHWTWDMFAGKFRDALQRGEDDASGASE